MVRHSIASKGFVFALLLSACQPVDVVQNIVPSSSSAPKRSIALAEGTFVATAPRGYCVDEASVLDTQTSLVVRFASCAGLRGGLLPPKARKTAVLTLSATEQLASVKSFDPERLETFFVSEQGQAAIARSQNAQDVEILASSHDDRSVVIHTRDLSSGNLEGVASDYWRMITTIDGRLVTLTATPLDHDPMKDADLQALLQRFARDLR